MAQRAKLTPASSARDVLLALASLGGHIKNNGDRGWRVIGRGLDDLLKAEVGYLIAISARKMCSIIRVERGPTGHIETARTRSHRAASTCAARELGPIGGAFRLILVDPLNQSGVTPRR